VQQRKIQSLEAIMKNAKVDLDETTVYAKNDGTVQNMFVALGTPIEIRKPLFSFIDIDSMAIQVNMNETELSDVRPGNTVTIVPRIYFGKKIYHGVIESIHWAANRQTTDNRTQEQIVNNSANNWFLLPQRIPIYIKITDYDPARYPLSAGESAYVYIHT
jgi:multidrug resistance efflux pump